MLNQLLDSLQKYSQLRINDVKKGLYSSKFAASLIQSYAESMIFGLNIIGKENYIISILSEADRLCLSVYVDYQPQLRLVYNQSKPDQAKRTGFRFGSARQENIESGKAAGW
jgi:hypothetical protein